MPLLVFRKPHKIRYLRSKKKKEFFFVCVASQHCALSHIDPNHLSSRISEPQFLKDVLYSKLVIVIHALQFGTHKWLHTQIMVHWSKWHTQSTTTNNVVLKRTGLTKNWFVFTVRFYLLQTEDTTFAPSFEIAAQVLHHVKKFNLKNIKNAQLEMLYWLINSCFQKIFFCLTKLVINNKINGSKKDWDFQTPAAPYLIHTKIYFVCVTNVIEVLSIVLHLFSQTLLATCDHMELMCDWKKQKKNKQNNNKKETFERWMK